MNKTILAIGLMFYFLQINLLLRIVFLGSQVGLRVWINYEFKLTNQITLRAEAGLNGSIWYQKSLYYGEDLGFVMSPVIKVEPRWYYNLEGRVKGRNIKGNSGNFLSLPIAYSPDWFLISSKGDDGMNMRPQISLVPTWGIRRTIGKHFNYEAGIGIGYAYAFEYKDNGYAYKADDATVANIHLRIGYHF
jgi:hypothetical protein